MDQLLKIALGWLTDRPLERRNVMWWILVSLFRGAAGRLSTGEVLQAFQVKLGIAKGMIGLISSSGGIAGAISMSSLMGIADKVRDRAAAVSNLLFLLAAVPLGLAILSLLADRGLTPFVAFAVMLALAAGDGFVANFMGLVWRSLFVHVIRNAIRGRYTGIDGLIIGFISIGVGLAAAKVLQQMGFPPGYTVCFGVAVALCVIAAMLLRQVKELPELMTARRTGSSSPVAALRDVWHLRQFRVLLIPFILRGIGDGAAFFIMAIGLQRLNLPDQYAGLATGVGSAAAMAGYVTISLTVDRFGPGIVCFFGDLIIAGSLVGIILTKTPRLWLTLYFMRGYGGTMEGAGIPLGCYFIVPRELMGAFSGARLMLLMGISALAVPAAGYLLDHFDPVPIFFAAALVKIVAGILYWWGFSQTYQHAPDEED